MAESNQFAIRTANALPPSRRDRSGMVVAIAALWGIVVAAVLAYLWMDNDVSRSGPGSYLIPWTVLSAACVLSPTAYLLYIGKFDLFHPLIFAVWSYIFPAFVIGGLIIAFGWVDPYFMFFIEDPQYTLPLTLVYISIGYLAVSAGFFLPVGKYLARVIEPRLPKWNWRPEQVWLPGVLLLIAGVGVNILGFIQGLLGFQRNIDVNIFDGLLFFLLTLLTEGTVLLWVAIFTTRERTATFYVIISILLIFIPVRMAVMGSRSSLIAGMLPIAFAYLYTGGKLRFRTMALWGILGVFAIFIGMTYGTTFRNIKGSEARINAGMYFSQVVATLEYLSNEDPLVILQQNAQALANRVDNLSSVAVVVSNYEKLAPYEASYGLENNIVNDLYTSFIPRFVWPEKPPTSDPRAYSDLYFNYGDNSFAISPFADLLRNFGVVGIVVGMLILGFYLRLIYTTLIDTPNPAMWKKVAYYVLLTAVSYEGFYATMFPSIVRILFVLAISFAIVNFLAAGRRRII